jgi:multidrug transporter EmrE-like cation transporter
VIDLDAGSIALMTLLGVLYMSAMYFYLQALQSEEASVIAPFYQASPLFGYALGHLVLGERLTPTQMIGGTLIISGALLVSLRSGGRSGHGLRRCVHLRVRLGAELADLQDICRARAVLGDDVLDVRGRGDLRRRLAGHRLVSPAVHRIAPVQYRRSVDDQRANELINISGALGNRYALVLAPLSLVQAIGSTTTLFVFIFGIALTLLFPRLGRESLSRRELLQMGAAAVLVAAGVALVSR